MIRTRGKVSLILTACIFALLSGCGFPGGSQKTEGNQRAGENLKRAGEFPQTVPAETGQSGGGEDTVSEEKNTSEGDDDAVGEDNVSEEGSDSLPEITGIIDEVLDKATKEMAGSYKIDDSFLLWMAGQYGRESLYALLQAVEESPQQMECWYGITGKSIHVLWVEYCQDTGIHRHYLDKVYKKECSDEDKVVMDFTGDINLAEGWSSTRYLDSQGGEIRDCFSASLWEEMQSADILMINNEFTFSERGMPLEGKAYTFRADPGRIGAITEIGTDVLSLANNHVYDYGEEALLDTLETVERAGIPYVGAGRNLEEAMKPVYFIANGRKIAIVSATQIERSTNYTREATDTEAGVLKTLNPDKFLSVIEEAGHYSDYVVAFVHWGTENTNDYGSDQVELGQKFIDAGADAVIGGHTHCLQGFDYYNGKPIIYSLGNYWFNDRTIDTGLSQLVIHTESNEIDFCFLPCIQQGCVTSLVEDEGEKQRILSFMQKISAPGVSVGADGSVTELP